MRVISLSSSVRLALVLLASLAMGADAADLQVVAPSPPGSGWDELAQAARAALTSDADSPSVEIVHVPGGSGTVGLARFLSDAPSDALLVSGLTMLEATLVQRTPVGLDRLTPIARLSSEYFALVVPAASPVTSVRDLTTAMLADPGKVAWAGGPARGLDHLAAVLFSQALAIDPIRLNYVSFLTSADAVIAIGQERVTAAILPIGEIEAEARAGRVRVLAVTSPARGEGSDVPTLVELGVPLELANWRGVLAKPQIGSEQRERLTRLVAKVAASQPWRAALARRGWQSSYLEADEFGLFIRREQARLKEALKAAGLLKPEPPEPGR
jgi:putative tricarboxylic transport membrane protein